MARRNIAAVLATLTAIALSGCANLYVEGAVGVVDNLPPVPQWAKDKFGPDANYKYDPDAVANPRGRVALGVEWNAPRSRFSMEVRHESWVGVTADKGEESVWAAVRIFPFRPGKGN